MHKQSSFLCLLCLTIMKKSNQSVKKLCAKLTSVLKKCVQKYLAYQREIT